MTWHGTITWQQQTLTRTLWDQQVVDNVTHLHDYRFDGANFDYAPVFAASTADLQLQSSPAYVPGGSATLNRAGLWMLYATWDGDLADGSGTIWGNLYGAGTLIQAQAVAELWAPQSTRMTFGAIVFYQTANATTVVQMAAYSDPGAPTGYVRIGNTRLTGFAVKAP